MSKTANKEAHFQEIALARFDVEEGATIDELTDAMEEGGLWSSDDDSDLLRRARKAECRRFARQPTVDKDGNRTEFFNVKRDEASTEERQQFFVFAHRITQPDLEWVIKDRVNKVDMYKSEVFRILGIYEGRFGKRARNLFQRRLNLDFEVET